MLIAIAIVCTLCEAIFTALEVALGAVPRARLRILLGEGENENAEHGDHEAAPNNITQKERRRQTAYRALMSGDRLTLLFIATTSLTLWTATALLAWQATADHWPWWALLAALLCIIFLAEVLPLQISARNPEAIAFAGIKFAGYSYSLLQPLIAALGATGHLLARLFGAKPQMTPGITEGELRTALETAEEEGVIESEERAMIEGAIDLPDKSVAEVMTPRNEIVAVSASATIEEILHLALREGHSRLPVFEGSLDTIIGIVATKDLLPHLRSHHADHSARDLLRPARTVPRHHTVAAALEEMRRKHTMLAIVTDDDAHTVGVVSLEDLLEELVGEIQDEHDDEEVGVDA